MAGNGFLSVKIPGFSILNGIETSTAGSVGEIASSIVSSAKNLIQAGKLAYCAGKMLTNPSMMKGVLDVLGGNILGAATQIGSRLTSLIRGQINMAIGQVVGSINGVIDSALGWLGSVFSFFGSIINLVKAVKSFLSDIFNAGKSDYDFFMSEEDCEYIFATIAACMLNKFLGNKIQTLETKLSSEIIESGDKLNSLLSDQLSDVNSVSSYLERERFMMEKATKQINGINNMLT